MISQGAIGIDVTNAPKSELQEIVGEPLGLWTLSFEGGPGDHCWHWINGAPTFHVYTQESLVRQAVASILLRTGKTLYPQRLEGIETLTLFVATIATEISEKNFIVPDTLDELPVAYNADFSVPGKFGVTKIERLGPVARRCGISKEVIHQVEEVVRATRKPAGWL